MREIVRAICGAVTNCPRQKLLIVCLAGWINFIQYAKQMSWKGIGRVPDKIE